MHVLLFNDVRDNLSEIFSTLKEFPEYFNEYRECFPYRLEDKFQEYIRLLGFLMTKNIINDEVLNLIKIRYSIMLSTLKFNRLKSILVESYNESTETNRAILNPTIIFLQLLQTDKNSQICKIFLFCKNDIDISIIDLDEGIFNFLKKFERIIINIDEAKLGLKSYETILDIEDLISAGIFILI